MATSLYLLAGNKANEASQAETGPSETGGAVNGCEDALGTRAKKCLDEYHGKVDEMARSNKLLAEGLALLDTQIAASQGDWYGAPKRLQDVVNVGDSQDPRVWLELGRAYGRTNQFRRSVDAYEKYLSVRRDDYVAMEDLGAFIPPKATGPRCISGRHRLDSSARRRTIPKTPTCWGCFGIEAVLNGGKGSQPSEKDLVDFRTELDSLAKANPNALKRACCSRFWRTRRRGRGRREMRPPSRRCVSRSRT